MTDAVGFIGLGDMGGDMARRLLAQGRAVTVFDLRPDAVEALEKEGATSAASAADVAASCELILTMLWSDEQVLNLMTSEGGLLDSCPEGRVVAIHSTIEPKTVRTVAAYAAEKGVHILDAPVSGGIAGKAIKGELTIMVGGDADVFERCRPVFSTLGSKVMRMGPNGAGAAAKLAINIMAIGNMLFAFQSIKFASGFGIGPNSLLELALETSGRSYSTKNIRGLLHKLRHSANPSVFEGVGKDLVDALGAANELSVDLPLVAYAASISTDLAREWEGTAGDALERGQD